MNFDICGSFKYQEDRVLEGWRKFFHQSNFTSNHLSAFLLVLNAHRLECYNYRNIVSERVMSEEDLATCLSAIFISVQVGSALGAR